MRRDSLKSYCPRATSRAFPVLKAGVGIGQKTEEQKRRCNGRGQALSGPQRDEQAHAWATRTGQQQGRTTVACRPAGYTTGARVGEVDPGQCGGGGWGGGRGLFCVAPGWRFFQSWLRRKLGLFRPVLETAPGGRKKKKGGKHNQPVSDVFPAPILSERMRGGGVWIPPGVHIK